MNERKEEKRGRTVIASTPMSYLTVTSSRRVRFVGNVWPTGLFQTTSTIPSTGRRLSNLVELWVSFMCDYESFFRLSHKKIRTQCKHTHTNGTILYVLCFERYINKKFFLLFGICRSSTRKCFRGTELRQTIRVTKEQYLALTNFESWPRAYYADKVDTIYRAEVVSHLLA